MAIANRNDKKKKTPKKIEIKLKARTADNRTIYSQNYILNCVRLVKEGDKATCNFTLEDGSYKPNFEFYNFRLTSNNTLGALTQNFTINHKEIGECKNSNQKY